MEWRRHWKHESGIGDDERTAQCDGELHIGAARDHDHDGAVWLQVIVDGAAQTAPFATTWVPGSSHTVSVTSPQETAGRNMCLPVGAMVSANRTR